MTQDLTLWVLLAGLSGLLWLLYCAAREDRPAAGHSEPDDENQRPDPPHQARSTSGRTPVVR